MFPSGVRCCVHGRAAPVVGKRFGKAGNAGRESIQIKTCLSYSLKVMNTYRVSLAFSLLSDGDFGDLAHTVHDKMSALPRFNAPPVPYVTFATNLATYDTALAATLNGGSQSTAAKNAAREIVDLSLRQYAAYVESLTLHDLEALLSSGYTNINTNTVSVPLATPSIVAIQNETTQQLVLSLERVDNARAYEVRLSYGTNGWQHAGTYTQTRRVELNNLTPGTTYSVQVRAVGGSTGYSNWSDPVSHMST